jgi:hypothetical protein
MRSQSKVRNLKYRQIWLFVSLFLIATLVFSCSSFGQNNEIKNSVVRLGNPLAADGKKGRALNVWDLQVFDGKVYIGGGNANTNAGPINVWAYDPTRKNFIKEYSVPEEEISRFKVIDNELYIPAADPRGGDANKFYRKKIGGQWIKYASNAVKLAHVRDLIKIDSQTIVMVGNNRNPDNRKKQAPGAAITTDNGISFQAAGANNIPDTGNVFLLDYNWFFSIFSYQDKIYAPNSFLRDTGGYPGSIAVYDPEKQELVIDFDLGTEEFIPTKNIDNKQGKYGLSTIYYLWNPVEFNNYLIYPVKSFSNADIDNSIKKLYLNSLGFYIKESMGKFPLEIKLPKKALGEDVLVIDGELYVLANKKNNQEKFTIYVFKTNEPQNRDRWIEVLSFKSSNKARSFEYLDGIFYFGLGQDYGDAIANSGDILSYAIN